MHDVAAGFWSPNDADKAANLDINFGTTINIINGDDECGHQSDAANDRGQYYKSFMQHF